MLAQFKNNRTLLTVFYGTVAMIYFMAKLIVPTHGQYIFLYAAIAACMLSIVLHTARPRISYRYGFMQTSIYLLFWALFSISDDLIYPKTTTLLLCAVYALILYKYNTHKYCAQDEY